MKAPIEPGDGLVMEGVATTGLVEADGGDTGADTPNLIEASSLAIANSSAAQPSCRSTASGSNTPSRTSLPHTGRCRPRYGARPGRDWHSPARCTTRAASTVRRSTSCPSARHAARSSPARRRRRPPMPRMGPVRPGYLWKRDRADRLGLTGYRSAATPRARGSPRWRTMGRQSSPRRPISRFSRRAGVGPAPLRPGDLGSRQRCAFSVLRACWDGSWHGVLWEVPTMRREGDSAGV